MVKVRTTQISPVETGCIQLAPAQIRIFQVGLMEINAAQISLHQVRILHLGTAERYTAQGAIGKPAPHPHLCHSLQYKPVIRIHDLIDQFDLCCHFYLLCQDLHISGMLYL
jgi:hypothetical protein